MSTGYTAGIEDGSITTLREFALRCARAFGACVRQRDDDMTDQPSLQEPNTYHSEALEEARAKLEVLFQMTDAEAIAASQDEHTKETDRAKKQHEKVDVTIDRYKDMREQIRRWSPPSDGHIGLRNFMLDQITLSLTGAYKADLPTQPPADWLRVNIAETMGKIEYHKKEHQAEVDRTSERNLWIRQLYESLPKKEKP